MGKFSNTSCAELVSRFQAFFTTRDVIFHDGRDLKRFSVGGRAQAVFAGMAAMTLCFSAYGVAQAAVGAVSASGITGEPTTPEGRIAAMQARVATMEANVAAIKQAASIHADRVEKRQALIAAVLSGKGDPEALAEAATRMVDPRVDAAAGDVVAPFKRVEAHQVSMAVRAREAAEQRFAATTTHLRKLGFAPERFGAGMPAMGGPLEPIDSAEAAADLQADAQFRSLFMTWKKLDTLEHAVIAIPALQPVNHLSFTSNFGVRTDPFTGGAAMHAGVDIPGPVGTPVYATADGTVDRAARAGGYGNLVELDHGKGIQTRYGHLSKILVTPGEHVQRGQLIALMGSTGRSTGPHLHYEVRIDGHAVNPVPFLQTADYLLALQDRSLRTQPIVATHNAPAAMSGGAAD